MQATLSALFKKKRQFVALLLAEVILFIAMDRYYCNNAVSLVVLNNLMDLNQNHMAVTSAPCKQLLQYPTSYYRKQIHHENNTFYAFAISIGELFSHHLTPNETKRYGTIIDNDLIQNVYKKASNRPLSPHKRFMRKMYYAYYRDLHSPSKPNMVPLDENICSPPDSVDFFEFINDGQYTNYTNKAKLNFYNKLPVERILGPNYRGAYSKAKLKNTSYFFPRLFSYTMSMEKAHDLKSLELRFVEIIDVLQHDATRHILLNNLQDKLLWAGEFWYFYDHKYKKYTLIIDASSGHFKPNINAIPHYLEHLLVQSLFPHYNHTKSAKNNYHPLILIGHKEALWIRAKKILFPVNHLIHLRDSQRSQAREKEKSEKIGNFLKSGSCKTLIGETVNRAVTKYNHTLKTVLKYIDYKLDKLKIACDANVTVNGWSAMSQKQEKALYKLLRKPYHI